MKLTKRQLNKIIAESLGIQSKVITEAVNFRKIRKDLFALEADIDNQALLDKVSDHAAELKAKVDAGETKFGKGRYREAVTLLKSLEELLKAPTPEKVKATKKVIAPAIEAEPEPTEPEPTEPEPTPWNPDPDPKVGWEYQVRECIWYTRKKETTKEYKLGHASGKPLQKGGKFLESIVSLNNAYPDLVKDCDPVKKKPAPKPADKVSSIEVKYVKIKGGESGVKSTVMEELVTAFKDFKGDGSFTKIVNKDGLPYDAADARIFGIKGIKWDMFAKRIADSADTKQYPLTSTSAVQILIKNLAGKETASQGKIVDVLPKVVYYAIPEGNQGTFGTGYVLLFAVTTDDTLQTDNKVMIYKFHVGASGNVVLGESVTNESASKSRGLLYRERYFGRY